MASPPSGSYPMVNGFVSPPIEDSAPINMITEQLDDLKVKTTTLKELLIKMDHERVAQELLGTQSVEATTAGPANVPNQTPEGKFFNDQINFKNAMIDKLQDVILERDNFDEKIKSQRLAAIKLKKEELDGKQAEIAVLRELVAGERMPSGGQ